MKKLLLVVLALCLMAGTANAALLAEYLFTSDTSDTANGFDGVLSPDGAFVAGGQLLLSGGGYMDIPLGGDNPFDGSSDFTIEMDVKTTTGGILISSARDDVSDNHSMSLYMWTDPDEGEIVYDNFYRGAAGAGGEAGTGNHPGEGEWFSLRVIYDHDHLTEGWIDLPASEWLCEWGEPEDVWCEDGTVWVGGHSPLAEPEEAPFIEVTLLDGQDWAWTGGWNPDIPDIHLDTVSLGRSLNARFPYEDLPDPGGWAMSLDNVRIYNHAVPEPATLMLLGLGGLGLLRRRRG